MTALFGIIGSILAIIIGLWKYFGRKATERRKQGEQARKDLDAANSNDDPGKFMDAFGRLH